MARGSDDDVMLRGMAQLVESQAERIEGLRRVATVLQGRVQARADLAVLAGIEGRAPLQGLRELLEDLRDAPDDERGPLIGAGLAHVARLEALLDQLGQTDPSVDVTPARARLRTIRLGDVVAQAVTAVATHVGAERLNISIDEDLQINTAPPRLLAILVALLESAAKHGPGPVDLTARFAPDRHLSLEVADRGHLATSVDTELALVRTLARSLGGDLAVAQRLGGGTIAGVWLPQRREEDPAPAEVSLRPADGGSH